MSDFTTVVILLAPDDDDQTNKAIMEDKIKPWLTAGCPHAGMSGGRFTGWLHDPLLTGDVFVFEVNYLPVSYLNALLRKQTWPHPGHNLVLYRGQDPNESLYRVEVF